MMAGVFYAHPVSGAIRPLTTELLRSVYLTPRPRQVFNLREALAGESHAPWSASMAIAPTETMTAVERSLRQLMLATTTLRPAEVDPSLVPAGSRARRHLEALLALWRSLGDMLPDDLWIMRHILEASASDAIESLPVLADDNRLLTAAERAVVDHLLAHHGPMPAEKTREHAEAAFARRARANTASLLGHVQRNMLDEKVDKRASDGSVLVFGLRDAAMEADVAAGIAQRLLDSDTFLAPREIGVLIPETAAYSMFIAEAFGRAGLPLSGLPAPADQKDLASETVQHFLLSRRIPAPAMALASLLASPLMPWPVETGRQLAKAIMRSDFRPAAAEALTGKATTLYRTIRKDDEPSPRALADELALLSNSLSDLPALRLFAQRTRELCGQLRALLLTQADAVSLPWDHLMRIAAPASATASMPSVRTTDGITIFTATEEPWREVSHLIVLGYAEGSYPSRASANPLFLDSEIKLINDDCGLEIRTQAELMGERLDLFRRQIGIASRSIVFLAPYRDLAGKRLAPASSLPLLARCIEGVSEPEDIVLDLDAVEDDDWPDVIPRALEIKSVSVALPGPEVPQIMLERDLLSLRVKDDGTVRRQSPSRLETMIVSPLAWLLNELEATEEVWAPEAVDVTRKGLLAHEVFEQLFLPGAPLPTSADIRERTPRLLAARIRQTAPFMQASAWSLERQSLEGEIIRAALCWRQALETDGALVINNEFWLRGTVFGVEIHGKADCLLRLNDGQLIIVDHKKSGTRTRQGRLQAGWDLQVELYRRMAQTAAQDDCADETLKLLASANRIGAAYHLMNDGGILVHGAKPANGSSAFTAFDSDISHAALTKLQEEIGRLRRGEVALNKAGDRKFYKDKAKMGLYAFESSPLIDAFTFIPTAGEDGEVDE